MAPLLALAGYGLADWWVKQQAPAGSEGRLVLLGTCQPRDNACLFKNPALEVKLISATKQNQLQIAAFFDEPVNDFSMALGNEAGFKQFPAMRSDDGKYWQLQLTPSDDITVYNQVRMAMKHQQTPIFAEAHVTF